MLHASPTSASPESSTIDVVCIAYLHWRLLYHRPISLSLLLRFFEPSPHQIRLVKYPTSITRVVDFVKTHFKKLDILVNNAGHMGITIVNEEKFRVGDRFVQVSDEKANMLNDILRQSYELAEECIKTNYYGTKAVMKALLPLLQLSKSPRIVNITSFYGELLAGKLEENGWPLTVSTYKVSKATINAYTRLLAEEYPNMLINCVHLGYVITDMSVQTGFITPEEGAKAPVMQESLVEVMVFLLGDKLIIFLLHSD
ncbi:hypothetical protein L2E82_47683 [Cichorium intybus]|uniref:Uncharacterized protein n=1 Tax=Cichorium intybus TaxID=13427 RepID=A0ACB8YW08_CICIN|nr:hypothetical protein L2E82_47683 [Cichorium intybus]